MMDEASDEKGFLGDGSDDEPFNNEEDVIEDAQTYNDRRR